MPYEKLRQLMDHGPVGFPKSESGALPAWTWYGGETGARAAGGRWDSVIGVGSGAAGLGDVDVCHLHVSSARADHRRADVADRRDAAG